LVAIADATTVAGDGSFRYQDRTYTRPASAGPGWTAVMLGRVLYQRAYLGRDATPSTDRPDTRPIFAREDPDLGADLRAAAGTRWYWQPGWQLTDEELPPGNFAVARQGLTLRVTDDELRFGDGGAQVRLPATRPHVAPGFFLITGIEGPAPGADVVRAYANVRPDGAAPLLRAIVESLDAAAVPFTFKVLNHPDEYGRPDAAVLYLRRRELPFAIRLLLDHSARRPLPFDAATPLFTRPIAAGIAVAEEPPAATVPTSFGQHRCAIVAGALVGAGPAATPSDRAAAITTAWRAAGLSLAAPHLNPGSAEFDLDIDLETDSDAAGAGG
jgi:hypothetical protein